MIEDRFVKFGFTRYEARAYMSRLENNPATGYELSQSSGVPRSAIYDIMRKLEKSGLVHSITSKPKQYVPLQPEELIKRLNEKFNTDIESLEEGMNSLNVSLDEDHLWTLNGYEELIERSKQMIKLAKKSIFMSLWTREAIELKQVLIAAEKRGLKVVLFSFTKLPLVSGDIYSYGIEENRLEKIWNHYFLLVTDKEEVLMGEARKGVNKKAAWTKNESLITIAVTNIILDITLFGLRFKKDVSENVKDMYNGSIDYLDELLNEINIKDILK